MKSLFSGFPQFYKIYFTAPNTTYVFFVNAYNDLNIDGERVAISAVTQPLSSEQRERGTGDRRKTLDSKESFLHSFVAA